MCTTVCAHCSVVCKLYSTVSLNKPGTSGASDRDINKCEVLCCQIRNIYCQCVHVFKESVTDFLKKQELTVQAYGIGRICTEVC
jgi:hypothetical protein